MGRAFLSRAGAALAVITFGVLVASCAGGRDAPGRVCAPSCTGFDICCPRGDLNTCTNPGNDPNNCGGCGVSCGAGGMCVSGVCVRGDGAVSGMDGSIPTGDCSPSCSSAQRCCGTTCVDRQVTAGTDGRTSTSFQNCNGCGIACDMERASACSQPLGMSGPPRCMCGNFDQCGGSEVCVQDGATFRCANLNSDRNNCGMVGRACSGDETCSGGVCGCGGSGPCAAGSTCCGGSCIDTSSDEMNCGGCGTVCPGGTTCTGGMCLCGTSACRAPSGTDLGQICCGGGCVEQNNSNCNGCGNVCEDGSTCMLGMGLSGGSMVCCGIALFPGMPGFCTDFGGGFGDAGFGLDAGLPFP